MHGSDGAAVEDVMITSQRWLHVLRPAVDPDGAELLLYILLRRGPANLALARRELGAARAALASGRPFSPRVGPGVTGRTDGSTGAPPQGRDGPRVGTGGSGTPAPVRGTPTPTGSLAGSLYRVAGPRPNGGASSVDPVNTQVSRDVDARVPAPRRGGAPLVRPAERPPPAPTRAAGAEVGGRAVPSGARAAGPARPTAPASDRARAPAQRRDGPARSRPAGAVERGPIAALPRRPGTTVLPRLEEQDGSGAPVPERLGHEPVPAPRGVPAPEATQSWATDAPALRRLLVALRRLV
ncbi:hypothetical protein [Pseudonocardia sp. T1-2H]|uniref:hypothetical protein n=1 Tax=Pseudonocardia sp. T1-2H TaxID=3128899 RepID=UPI0031010905